MIYLYFLPFLFSNTIIFDFDHNCDLSNWSIVDDVVMGGRSNGQLKIDDDGHAVFTGLISLENNGGFSSLRYRHKQKNIKSYNKFVIRLKGDGKRYQFRVKSNKNDRHSYISHFQTTGDWQSIKIPFSEMYPSFRGWRLDYPNFPGETLEETAFLIGNKQKEKFQLQIDYIGLE